MPAGLVLIWFGFAGFDAIAQQGSTELPVATSPVPAAVCRPWQAEDADRQDLLIGRIEVDARDVFDTTLPAENRLIHRLANRWHVSTRPEVIRQALVFRVGESYRRALLDASERRLRARRYLNSAKITETRVCGNKVDIAVETTDQWSLNGNFSLERAGGINDYRLGVTESNLLGTGQSFWFDALRDAQRDTLNLGWYNPNLFNKGLELTVDVSDYSDGDGVYLLLQQPFAGFYGERGWYIRYRNTDAIGSYYRQGERVGQFRRVQQSLLAGYGTARHRDDWVRRLRVGVELSGAEFSEPAGELPAEGDLSAEDRRSHYPWLAIDWIQDRWAEHENMTVMGAVEDFSLGHQLTLSAGLGLRALDNAQDFLALEARYRKGFATGGNTIGSVALGTSMRLDRDGLSHSTDTADIRWYHFFNPDRSLYLRFGAGNIRQPWLDEQLHVGGNNGLRGYPLKVQSGYRRLTGSIEFRLYSRWYPWHLFRFGAAFFADAGSAWSSDSPDWLHDVGVGLRIVSARQSDNRVLHLDLAAPLAADDADGVQFVIKTRAEF